MRILPAALAISAALHGGAIAWVESRPDPKPEKKAVVTLQPIEIVPASTAEPVPTEVTLLDDDTVATAAPIASSRSNTKHGKGQQHITTGHAMTGTTIGEKPPTGETPPPRNPLMTMRHPKIEKGLSAEFWARFEANTKPLKPKEIAGERIADEIDQAADNLHNPRWVANATPDELTGERMKLAGARDAQANAELKPDGEGTKAEHHTFKAKFDPDGTVASIDDKRNFRFHKIPLSGEFDVTDAMMRHKGIDPYASYKLKVLDETRDERAAIGKRYRTQQLGQSKQHMQKNLARLWQTTSDLKARKQGLFELWDDCAETGSEELVAGGKSAREYIVGFIRTKLPAGSTDAFTQTELAHFNKQRKSQAPFAPYETM